MKVTVIGLGIMGSRMAKNLIKAGFELCVYNRTKEKSTSFEGKARIADSPADAVKTADVVLTMLSKPEAVEQVMLGDSGALQHMKPNAIWLDGSTVNPSFTLRANKAAKEKDIRFMDAPVAGTLPHAENGELVFFTGGTEEILGEVRPLLDAMGKKVLHIGETGKGASFKMLVNSMLGQTMLAFAETLLLGEKMGMEKDFLLNTLPHLVVSPPFTQFKAEMIRKDDYSVMFPLELMHKDLHLAALSAYENEHPFILGNTTKEIFANAKKAGLGREDFAAIYKYLGNDE